MACPPVGLAAVADSSPGLRRAQLDRGGHDQRRLRWLLRWLAMARGFVSQKSVVDANRNFTKTSSNKFVDGLWDFSRWRRWLVVIVAVASGGN